MEKQAAPNMAHPPTPAQHLNSSHRPGVPWYLEHRLRTLPAYLLIEHEEAQGKTQPLAQVLQGRLVRSPSGQDSWISHPLLPFVPVIWLHPPLPVGP